MDHLTLSERVARLENILVETGVAGDRNENAEPDYRQKEENYLLDKAARISGMAQEWARHQERAGPSPKQADQTAFDEIIQRISNCNDRVCLTADRLQKIGDRIMGGIPEMPYNGEDEGTQKSPDGTLDHTFMALNSLDASLSRLEQVALRMERV